MRILTIFALTALVSAPALAVESAPVGQLTIKMNGPSPRQRLEVVEKDIARLDHEIVDVRGQAQVARATGGTNSAQASILQSLASAYELQRAGLVSEREQLITEIKSSK
jgi:hypothetical protein